MTLNDLLGLYVTDPVDINVEAHDGFFFISGAGGIVPLKLRDRKVSHFTVDTRTFMDKHIPVLVVNVMKGA